MARRVSQSLECGIPAYKINVNISDFAYKKSSLKEKLQKEFIPYYWQKCGMNQKKVVASSEDRLSELTTGQIDRIIDMEKIKSLLYDRKRRVKDSYFEYDPTPTRHPNVYQANFLARINQIAIKRDVRHEDLSGFDEAAKQRLERLKTKREQKQHMPFKYAKRYRADEISERKARRGQEEADETKSIASISDDLEQFEERMESIEKSSNNSLTRRTRAKTPASQLLPRKRWFYGMSTYYLDKNQPDEAPPKEEIMKTVCYDIEAEVKLISQIKSNSFSASKNHGNITQSTSSTKGREYLRPKTKTHHITFVKEI